MKFSSPPARLESVMGERSWRLQLRAGGAGDGAEDSSLEMRELELELELKTPKIGC